ncbi:DUF167 domain-containing protein [Solwaraspora sp. WMMD406]|uniref:DUF167 domain-containing protein n=1 Tax=Solwaraspora sp. WMMD406 TaxID=3016095 RepID=UPI002417F137|nr:DUF167 domain-containing protein [Solwaraspora sp. WMMD406]MDG4765347.1 DUF167 domain-containing protein [Solwaraspora sp. WMMD406]
MPPPDTELTVAVRVKPASARPMVGGCHEGPHGPALVIAVHAPAVDGRATEAARRALADALDVPPKWVSLRVGANSRDKVFTVDVVAAGRSVGSGARARLRRLRDGAS